MSLNHLPVLAVLLLVLACDGGTAAGGGAGSGGSTAGGSNAGGSTAGGSSAGGSNAGGSNAGGSSAGGSSAGGSSAGGSNAGGSSAGGSSAGGSSAGGSNAGGSNAGGSNAGGSSAGGSSAGGSGAGGSNAGGSNAGGENAGGAGPFCDVVDQSQTSFTQGFYWHNSWQTFTAGRTGNLYGIVIAKTGPSGPETVTLNIFEGAGDGGTLLHTEQTVLSNVTMDFTIELSASVPVTLGSVYTFQIDDSSGTLNLLIEGGMGSYAGGALHWPGHPEYDVTDMRFKTLVECP